MAEQALAQEAMAETTASTVRPPLCVDLDGTLVATDLFAEASLSAISDSPLTAVRALASFSGGRAKAKAFVAAKGPVDVETLPYRTDVLSWLAGEKASGRRIVLATAADESLAKKVSAHLGLFDEVLASDGTTNLKGGAKAAALVAKFGAKGFAYAGDSSTDLDVWKYASEAIVVGDEALAQKARGLAPVVKTFPAGTGRLRASVKALRVHQWLKNLLVVLPALAAHRWKDQHVALSAALAFAAFSLCASAVYVANDLADLTADRRHRTKKNRPFAAGTLPVFWGLAAVPVLTMSAAALSFFLPAKFALVLAGYFALTTLYTFWLKRIALVDVLCLAGLYVVRIFAGGGATSVPVSEWLLAFALFLFFSLALVKRVAELKTAEAGGSSLKGRGYEPGDLDVLRQMGVASGYLAVLVLALYLQSEKVASLYRHPDRLWLACPLLLFWVSRAWLLAHRGRMHDDPVVFAVRDRVSLLVGALLAAVLVLAT